MSSQDDVEPRWCTVRKNYAVPKYGNASAYVGLRFSKGKEAGTIAAVVRNSSFCNGELHFAIDMDSNKSDGCRDYILCKTMMSTSKSNMYKVCIIVIIACCCYGYCYCYVCR